MGHGLISISAKSFFVLIKCLKFLTLDEFGLFFYGVNSSNQNSLNGELYGKFHFLFSISGHRAEPIET